MPAIRSTPGLSLRKPERRALTRRARSGRGGGSSLPRQCFEMRQRFFARDANVVKPRAVVADRLPLAENTRTSCLLL